MKKYIFLIGCMLLMLVSCQTSVLDPLEGIFTPPTVSEDFSIVKCDAYKSEGKRIFELHLGGPVTLQATLVGDAYYLTSNAYTEATEANAKKGNFILGKTTVNGAQVETGTITVTQEDFSYRIKAILFVAGGAAYKLSWSGNLQFEPDPEPVVLTKLLVAQANGNNTVTFKLGTDDMGLDMMGTPEGNGFALTADVYSADGFLAEGVYTPAVDHDNVGPGQYAPGYEYDLSEYGLGIMHWGTCWWEWPTVTHIDKEPITVTKKGSTFTITWGSEETYPNWATFTGEIPELTPQGGGGGDDYDGVSLTQNFGIIDYSMYGMNMVGIELGTEGIVATPGGWGNTYTGNGNYLKLEIYAENGRIEPGTYKACAEGGVIGKGEFGIGYDGLYGASGTTWYTLVNDEATYQYITDGTVVVELDGDDYKITIESTVVNARYGFGEGGSGDDSGDDDFDGAVLTQFCSLVDYYSMYQVNLVGMELATAGVTVTPGAWGNTYGGDGNYIKLELYTADGSVAPGTYTPCATGGEVTEGTFGIGYDGAWGASGTTWYTLVGGEATYTYVTDGTVTVSVEGNVYTITIDSSTVKAQYKGMLSAE